MANETKYTIKLAPPMERLLDEMATEQGVTKAQVIRRALGLMKYLHQEREKGHVVRIRDEHGNEKEIVFESEVVSR